MSACGACGGEMTEEVERTTRRLLAALGGVRAAALTELYGGQAPHVLCAGCFNLNLSNLNRSVSAHALESG